MTSLAVVRKQLIAMVTEPVPGAPESVITLAPRDTEEAAQILALASDHDLPVLIWGGGTHQGYGRRVAPAIVLSTHRLRRLDWKPDDLTATVGAGVRVADLEETLAGRNQSAVLPEHPGDATVGGVVAAGLSGYRRLRYGPTRDRVLGMTLVTGDGRIVHGGGIVVKNVSGYDLPRLATGSYGALGLITEVNLKLWPNPPAAATVTVDRAEDALEVTYRPLAILDDRSTATVALAGHADAVAAQVEALGATSKPGAHWPERPTGILRAVVRVPARHVRETLGRIPTSWQALAAIGVGDVTVAADRVELDTLRSLRGWAESVGGALVIEKASDDVYEQFDPWGTPPGTIAIQRRLLARFDPAGIVNPGRLLGAGR